MLQQSSRHYGHLMANLDLTPKEEPQHTCQSRGQASTTGKREKARPTCKKKEKAYLILREQRSSTYARLCSSEGLGKFGTSRSYSHGLTVTNVPPLSWRTPREFSKFREGHALGGSVRPSVRSYQPPPPATWEDSGRMNKPTERRGKKNNWCALHPNRNREVLNYQSYVSGFFTPLSYLSAGPIK